MKQSMNKPLNESKRIAELEEIRTPQNSNIIDEAIALGKTAPEIAHKIVKSENDALKAVDSIATAMNQNRR
jgi:hypothetical protein